MRLAVAYQPIVAIVGRSPDPGGTARGVGGCGLLAGYVIVGLGLLLPWMSWPQLVVFGVGLLIGLPAYLGMPVWFVFLGRHLGTL